MAIKVAFAGTPAVDYKLLITNDADGEFLDSTNAFQATEQRLELVESGSYPGDYSVTITPPSGTYSLTGRIINADDSDECEGAFTLVVVDGNEVVRANNSAGEVIAAADEIQDAVAEKIAHIILRRTMASVEASSDGEAVSLSSLYGLIQQAQESSRSSTTLTVKQTDGSTTLGTKTLTVNASANPITGIS